MAEINEPTKQQKEQAAYGRITRILRSKGLTPEEIEAHPEVADHPGRPNAEAVTATRAANAAAVLVKRDESKGPAKGPAPKAEKKPAQEPAKAAKSVPIVDASAGPPITKLPAVLDGGWNEGNEGNEGGDA